MRLVTSKVCCMQHLCDWNLTSNHKEFYCVAVSSGHCGVASIVMLLMSDEMKYYLSDEITASASWLVTLVIMVG